MSDDDAAAIADRVVSLMEERHGIKLHEAVDLMRWAKAQRERNAKMLQGGSLSILGAIITGIAIALWEGFRLLMKAKGAG